MEAGCELVYVTGLFCILFLQSSYHAFSLHDWIFNEGNIFLEIKEILSHVLADSTTDMSASCKQIT